MPEGPRLRPHLRGIDAYVPGRSATVEAGRLASNEAPAPAIDVPDTPCDALPALNRYPDPSAGALRAELASYHGLSGPEHVAVGNGSDELIWLLVLAYASQGGSIVTATPGYGLYGLCARQLGAHVHEVQLDGWTRDLDAMAAVPSDIAFVCNPHNPTGTIVSREAFREFVDRRRARLVVVDEAYADFADDPDEEALGQASDSTDLVVIRTFSKAWGLAGIRVGYLVGHPAVVTTLHALKLPFSVNSVGQALALRAAVGRSQRSRLVASVRAMRARVTRLFEGLGYAVVPSQANFVLVLTSREEYLVAHLASSGVSVRPGTALGVPGAVRVTIPDAAGYELLCAAMRTREGEEAS